MPSTSTSHTVTVAEPAISIWNTLQDADTWANIGPVERVWDPVHDESGHLASYQWSATVAGQEYVGSATTRASEPGSIMQLELDGGEVAGVLTTELAESAPSSTDVTVTLEVSSRGTLSAMFFPLIANAINQGFPHQVEEFAARITGDGGPS